VAVACHAGGARRGGVPHRDGDGRLIGGALRSRDARAKRTDEAVPPLADVVRGSAGSEALQNIGADVFDVGLRGGGLRGGNFAITEDEFRLNRYEYVPGVRFTSRWTTESDRLGPLHIDGPGSLDGVLRLREADDLTFRVRGRLAGRRVHTRVRIRSRLLELFSSVETGGGPAQAAPRGPNLRSDAPGSCRLPLLRDLPGACAHG
jgi:hypothetical protein